MMHVIAKKRLKAFWERHAGATGPLRGWRQEAEHADLANPAQVKQQFPKASVISDSRVVFDIKWERLLVRRGHLVRR
jgi:mRNA interferase HigB